MRPVTKKWLFLRISSFILIPLMLWFIINFVSFYDKNYQEILKFLTTQPSNFLFSLFLIFAYFFSALSISEIFEDYIKNSEKTIQSIFSFEDKQLILLGKFLILGKLYLLTTTLMVVIFPISKFCNSVILDLSTTS